MNNHGGLDDLRGVVERACSAVSRGDAPGSVAAYIWSNITAHLQAERNQAKAQTLTEVREALPQAVSMTGGLDHPKAEEWPSIEREHAVALVLAVFDQATEESHDSLSSNHRQLIETLNRHHGYSGAFYREVAHVIERLDQELARYKAVWEQLLSDESIEAAVDAAAPMNERGEVVGDEIDFEAGIRAALYHALAQAGKRDVQEQGEPEQ